MSFGELAEWAQNRILQGLIKGDYAAMVYTTMIAVLDWKEGQNEKKKS